MALLGVQAATIVRPALVSHPPPVHGVVHPMFLWIAAIDIVVVRSKRGPVDHLGRAGTVTVERAAESSGLIAMAIVAMRRRRR